MRVLKRSRLVFSPTLWCSPYTAFKGTRVNIVFPLLVFTNAFLSVVSSRGKEREREMVGWLVGWLVS